MTSRSLSAALLCAACCMSGGAQAQMPPEGGTPPAVAAKLALRGEPYGIAVREMRVVRRNDVLVVQADIVNADRRDRAVFHRFRWLDANGNPVGDGESWKQLGVPGLGQQTVKSVAPSGAATDFRLEMNVEPR